MGELIVLGKPKEEKKWASITEQLQKQSQIKSTPLRLLTSPKTTAVLTTALLGLMHPAAAVGLVKGAAAKVGTVLAKHPLRYAAGGLIGTGILVESPKARKYVKETPKRLLGYGEKIGGYIEQPEKVKEDVEKKGWWPTTKEAVKKAGIYGGITAGVLGLGVAGKKLLEKRKAKQVGITEKDIAIPSPTLKQPYLPSQYPVISPVEGAGALKQAPPIQNIIQIQVQ